MNDATSNPADPAWAPLLAAAYALLAVGGTLFLAAGFTQVDSLLVSLGSIAPASEQIGRFVAIAIIGIVAMIASTSLVRARLSLISSEAIGPRVLGVLIIAFVLMAPPVQWIMFGRPDPMSAHLHKMAAMNSDKECVKGEHGAEADAHHEDAEGACEEETADGHHQSESDHAEH